MTQSMKRAVRRTSAALGAAAVVVFAVTKDPVAAQNANRPDFSGTWALDRELSDKSSSTPSAPGGSEDMARRPSGRGGTGGPGGRIGGRGGSNAGVPKSNEVERRRAAIDAAARVAASLVIVQTDGGLVVTDGEGLSIRIPLDGRKETGAANGVPFETVAHWEGGRLGVQREFRGGLKVVDDYSPTSDPCLLLISSKLEGGGLPFAGTVVNRASYQQATPAASPGR